MVTTDRQGEKDEHVAEGSGAWSSPSNGHHEQQQQQQHVDQFFARNGCDARTREACDQFARLRFPDTEITPCQLQGCCSYTLILSTGHLVQFRPEAFRLDIDRCNQAKAIYGHLAPKTSFVGTLEAIPRPGSATAGAPIMRVYLLERIPGVPYSEFRARPEFADNAREFRERLLGDLAWALALSFQSRKSPDSILLLDGTDADTGAGASRLARGRVGSSLRARLELLEALPAHAQRHVSEVARRLDAVEGSPWCLTHGDLVAGNVMVDPATGHLTGLVDWAEAEWLPFGVALYGVEEVLGGAGEGPGFAYCAGHEELRRHFWDRLLALSRCGDLGIRPWLGEVEAARKLGVLLWVGIAFDEGRIDRVIEPGRDEAEMQKLTPFLEAACPVDAAGDGDRERGRRGSRVGIWLRELGVAFGQLCR